MLHLAKELLRSTPTGPVYTLGLREEMVASVAGGRPRPLRGRPAPMYRTPHPHIQDAPPIYRTPPPPYTGRHTPQTGRPAPYTGRPAPIYRTPRLPDGTPRPHRQLQTTPGPLNLLRLSRWSSPPDSVAVGLSDERPTLATPGLDWPSRSRLSWRC